MKLLIEPHAQREFDNHIDWLAECSPSAIRHPPPAGLLYSFLTRSIVCSIFRKAHRISVADSVRP